MKDEIQYMVIPAAGLGKRMRCVNPDVPKEMLPVGSKPAIQYAIEEGFSAGIRNIIIIINKEKEVIRRYLEDREYRARLFPLAVERINEIERASNITFLYQERPLGESDAIALTEEIVRDNPFAIIYPDNIYLPSPGALTTLKPIFFEFMKDTIALMMVTDENCKGISNSGRVDVRRIKDNVFEIIRFYPKGDEYFNLRFKEELRTCGISISGPHLFEFIKRARETVREGEFTDTPVRMMMLMEMGLIGYRLEGTVFDIGNPEGYRLCLNHLK